jgi:N utilization substance protein B
MPHKNIGNKEKPLGILRRSEARMAAVKALYAHNISANFDEKTDPWMVTLGIISSYDDANADHHFKVRPDEKFLAKIISGVFDNLEGIDAIIGRNLAEGWTTERMGNVMVALLRAAVFELSASQKLPFKVIINEYVDIAQAFFNEKESGFVNGILDKISREVRD